MYAEEAAHENLEVKDDFVEESAPRGSNRDDRTIWQQQLQPSLLHPSWLLAEDQFDDSKDHREKMDDSFSHSVSFFNFL